MLMNLILKCSHYTDGCPTQKQKLFYEGLIVPLCKCALRYVMYAWAYRGGKNSRIEDGGRIVCMPACWSAIERKGGGGGGGSVP